MRRRKCPLISDATKTKQLNGIDCGGDKLRRRGGLTSYCALAHTCLGRCVPRRCTETAGKGQTHHHHHHHHTTNTNMARCQPEPLPAGLRVESYCSTSHTTTTTTTIPVCRHSCPTLRPYRRRKERAEIIQPLYLLVAVWGCPSHCQQSTCQLSVFGGLPQGKKSLLEGRPLGRNGCAGWGVMMVVSCRVAHTVQRRDTGGEAGGTFAAALTCHAGRCTRAVSISEFCPHLYHVHWVHRDASRTAWHVLTREW